MKRLSLDPARIPADGALGLLAHGDVALEAWRRKRAAVEGDDWRERLARRLAEEGEKCGLAVGPAVERGHDPD